MLMTEIRTLEQEVAYPISKRLREEVAELEEELEGKEVFMFELAAENDYGFTLCSPKRKKSLRQRRRRLTSCWS
jgi:hypothetical protein